MASDGDKDGLWGRLSVELVREVVIGLSLVLDQQAFLESRRVSHDIEKTIQLIELESTFVCPKRGVAPVVWEEFTDDSEEGEDNSDESSDESSDDPEEATTHSLWGPVRV